MFWKDKSYFKEKEEKGGEGRDKVEAERKGRAGRKMVAANHWISRQLAS